MYAHVLYTPLLCSIMMKTSFAVLMMLLDLSSSQSCLFHEEMLCNGEVFVTLNYHRQVRPCPCVIIASSAPCDDRNLCIDVLFDDDSMKCVEWTSYPPGYEYYGKNETTACFNSSSVVGRTIKLICRIHHVDSDPPLDIIFKGVCSIILQESIYKLSCCRTSGYVMSNTRYNYVHR